MGSIFTMQATNTPFKFKAQDPEPRDRRPGLAPSALNRVVELWLMAVLVTFFLVRVLGSNTVQRLLDRLRHAHLS